MNVSVALAAGSSPLLVDAYEGVGVGAAVGTSPAVVSFAGADGTCSWRLLNASAPSLQLAPDVAAAAWVVGADGSLASPLTQTVEGPPSATAYVQVVCRVWGTFQVASVPLEVRTRPYEVVLTGAGPDGVLRRVVWPSGAMATQLAAWGAIIAATAPARIVLTCALAVVGVSTPPRAATDGVGLGLDDASVSLVGEPAVSISLTPTATRANITLPRVGVRAAGGTIAVLELTCRDGAGRSGTAPQLVNVTVGALAAAWDAAAAAALPVMIVPGQALPPLALSLTTLPAIAFPPALAPAATAVSCTVAIFHDTGVSLPTGVPLEATTAGGALAAAGVADVRVDGARGNASLAIVVAPISTAACPLGTPLAVVAECTWTPTGERVRLPVLHSATLPLELSWVAPPAAVQGYIGVALRVRVTSGAAVAGQSTARVACEVRLVNTTVRAATVAADGWEYTVNPAAPTGTVLEAAPIVTAQAPPGATLYLAAVCTAWGATLVSPMLRLAVATPTLRLTSALPTSFIASDASSPWPVKPPLVLAASTEEGGEAVGDAVCSLTTPTPAAVLLIVDSATHVTSLLSIPVDVAGLVHVPLFVVVTSPTTPAVSLRMECKRATSGDVLPAVLLTIPAVQLAMVTCTPPAGESLVATALPPFVVGVRTTLLGGATTSPCDPPPPGGHTALPPIVCSIGLDIAATTINDTSNIFLQHTLATMAAASHTATFDAFTVVAPQGERYGLTLGCKVGDTAVPPPLAWTVSLDGCPPGQQAVSVTCITCAADAFSLGGLHATCIACPPAGAACDSGVITLLPHYYRPPAQAGQALGPDTELHPCYNADACTLAVNNISDAVYGCTTGYSGPLCGVCDTSVNYARFGDGCALCWSPVASGFFLAVVLTAVLGVLIRVALRTETGRSDASIVLRITLSYLQAVGSLRVFRAGSTQAYQSLMGWTEVVSASPFSVGALQCLLNLPYLFQYAGTVALPAIASVAVVIIFLTVTLARSCRCRPVCMFDAPSLRIALAAWLASKRHVSTLLFVLFLAYMPITSASLRALDCIDPVAGVRYLRSDLSVACGVGEHEVARIMAYAVLVVVGIGFPAGLAWLLGTARSDTLADTAFHATWGFLFEGYRTPLRSLVGSAGGGGGSTGGAAKGAAGERAPRASTLTLSPQPLPPLLLGSKPRARVAALATGSPPRGSAIGRRGSVLVARLTAIWQVTGDSRVWWEAVVLLRKGGVVLLAVLVTNPYLQSVGATLWFAGAIALQARFAPYSKRNFNRLEMATLVAAFLTAVVSTALLQFNVDTRAADLHTAESMTPIEWTVTVALALMNLGTFAVLALLWLHLQSRKVVSRLPRVASTVARTRARLGLSLRSMSGGIGGDGSGGGSGSPSAASTPPVLDADDGGIVNPLHLGRMQGGDEAAKGSALPAALAAGPWAVTRVGGVDYHRRRHNQVGGIVRLAAAPRPVTSRLSLAGGALLPVAIAPTATSVPQDGATTSTASRRRSTSFGSTTRSPSPTLAPRTRAPSFTAAAADGALVATAASRRRRSTSIPET